MRSFWFPALTVCMLASAASDGLRSRWFEEIAAEAGLGHRHHKRTFDNPYAEVMQGYTALGASVAIADFDDDGFEDVFLTDSSADGHNRLFRNDEGRRFVDVTAHSGIGSGNDARNASADASWFDCNNDGRPDLFVVRFGRSLLYENLGNGKFRERSQAAGVDQYRNAITAIAFDYDRDGFLDLFIGSYFQPIDIFRPRTPRFFPENFETANNGGGVTVFRNRGNGTFEDATAAAGFRLSGWTLDLGHADFDNDGDDDLYVAADFGADRLFINNGDGTFRDATEKAIGIDTKKGMNVDWGDFDNDGLLDVVVVNGDVRGIEELVRAGDPFPFGQPDQLFRNLGGGAFGEVPAARAGSAFARAEVGRGLAVGDVDDDGDPDLLITNANGPARLLLDTVGQDRPWVGLRLVGGAARRDLLGARATVEYSGGGSASARVRTDASYCSARDPRLRFAVPAGETVRRVRVQWPDGSEETFGEVAPGRYSVLRQGEGR